MSPPPSSLLRFLSMGVLRSESVMCPVDQHCFQWVRRHVGLCICGTRHGFSLALGVVSVISWCVAEIPQIITNYKKKSAEGLSILFLLTWIVGDFFNLLGCILEPATLSTQYYVAVLYAVTTLILTSQAVYYKHIYPHLKSRKRRQEAVQNGHVDRREANYDADTEKSSMTDKCGLPLSSPVPIAFSSDSSSELFFTSARSLSVSHIPTPGSFSAARSSTLDIEQRLFKEPLLGEFRMSQSAPPNIKTMLCVVSLMTFLLGSHDQLQAERLGNNTVPKYPRGGIVLPVGRQLLEENAATQGTTREILAEGSGLGTLFGWGMAAIYLGGRLPQIYLNIRRGHTEGLNPLMFVFAVIGNATYVASILLNSIEWSKIRPNLPWLVDSGGCVILDVFILIQFVLFRYRLRREVEKYES